MIAKITTGSDFAGALEYDLNKKGSEFISSNLISLHEDINAMAQEMDEISNLKQSVKKKVHHVSLSAAPNEHLSNSEWEAVAKEYMRRMKFKDNQYVITRHTDTKIDHIHIVINRIDMTGKVVSDSNERIRANNACEAIEKKFSLHETNHSHKPTPHLKPKISRSDKEAGTVETKQVLINRIDSLLEKMVNDNFTFTPEAFAKAAKMNGIDIQYNKVNGSIRGVSYKLTNSNFPAFSGSKLRRDFTLGNIEKTLNSTGINKYSLLNKELKSFTTEQKKTLIKSLSNNNIIATPTNYGMKLSIGNWHGVIFDNSSSLSIKGFPDPELTATALLEAAKTKGWKAITINDCSEYEAELITEAAEAAGIEVKTISIETDKTKSGGKGK